MYILYTGSFLTAPPSPLKLPVSNQLQKMLESHRVAEVAREHRWHPPKSLESDESFKPKHTLFCRELRFVAIYALFLEIFGQKSALLGKNSASWARSVLFFFLHIFSLKSKLLP